MVDYKQISDEDWVMQAEQEVMTDFKEILSIVKLLPVQVKNMIIAKYAGLTYEEMALVYKLPVASCEFLYLDGLAILREEIKPWKATL